MFISGISRLDNIITEEQRLAAKNSMLKAHSENRLFLENDSYHYKNSYGTVSLPEVDELYNTLTPIVEHVTGCKLEKQNSYSRIYNNESTLAEHTDREGLEITLSLQIDNTTGLPQPIFCQSYSGEIMNAELNNKDCVVIRGRDLIHWRNPLKTAVEGGQLFCSFFHWKVIDGFFLEQKNLLTDQECDEIIRKAESQGFEKSMVLKNGESVHDDYSRTSSTKWFTDDIGLTTKMKSRVPELKDIPSEGWQLVKYETGEQFRNHYDCLNKEKDRLFTTIIYLNDNFEGGETNFPNINKTMKPEKGKLVIWKNLENFKCDGRFLHSGEPVVSGVKYILVNWMLNYK